MVRTSRCKGKIRVSGACFVASMQGPMTIKGGFGELCVVCLFCTPGHACHRAQATLTWVASHLPAMSGKHVFTVGVAHCCTWNATTGRDHAPVWPPGARSPLAWKWDSREDDGMAARRPQPPAQQEHVAESIGLFRRRVSDDLRRR
jgi:hypothetical protein